jgi:UDP:flavonoid glycosyltransferase YjiC (YdhE family)
VKPIVFILDFFVGHALPVIHLATSLQERDLRVEFLGIPNIEPYVAEHGIPFHPILEEVYPEGIENDPVNFQSHLQYILTDNPVDRLLKKFDPALLITNYFIAVETLVFWYKHRIPTAIFTPFFREQRLDPATMAIEHLIRIGGDAYKFVNLIQQCGANISSLPDLVSPLKNMPEFIGCPKELDFDGVDRGDNVRYMEPCIRKTATRPKDFEWPDLEKNTKLIYISFGSQVVSHLEKVRGYYRLLMDVIEHTGERDWFYIFSFSPHIDRRGFEPLPDNARLYHWVPQLEVLARASLCINHGGLGTIKECVYYGVPMLVFPFAADQFKNGERVKQRNVGDIGKADISGILKQIETLMTDGTEAAGLRILQKLFLTQQEQCVGANMIKNLISSQK